MPNVWPWPPGRDKSQSRWLSARLLRNRNHLASPDHFACEFHRAYIDSVFVSMSLSSAAVHRPTSQTCSNVRSDAAELLALERPTIRRSLRLMRSRSSRAKPVRSVRRRSAAKRSAAQACRPLQFHRQIAPPAFLRQRRSAGPAGLDEWCGVPVWMRSAFVIATAIIELSRIRVRTVVGVRCRIVVAIECVLSRCHRPLRGSVESSVCDHRSTLPWTSYRYAPSAHSPPWVVASAESRVSGSAHNSSMARKYAHTLTVGFAAH